MQEKSFRTGSGTIRYWTEKQSDADRWLIFIPGLCTDHRLFAKNLEALPEGWNALLWDTPGHGMSRPFQLGFSLSDLASYLKDILTIEGIEAPVLIGMSLGGYIAQRYILSYGAAGFISVDSAPLQRRYYTKAELFLLRHTKLMYSLFPWNLLLKLSENGNSTTEYGKKLIREMFSIYSKKEFCELAAHGYRMLADGAENTIPVRCPTLLIRGEKDRAGSVKRYNRNWAKMENLPLRIVPGAGHASNADNPSFVNEAIASFLKTL